MLFPPSECMDGVEVSGRVGMNLKLRDSNVKTEAKWLTSGRTRQTSTEPNRIQLAFFDRVRLTPAWASGRSCTTFSCRVLSCSPVLAVMPCDLFFGVRVDNHPSCAFFSGSIL